MVDQLFHMTLLAADGDIKSSSVSSSAHNNTPGVPLSRTLLWTNVLGNTSRSYEKQTGATTSSCSVGFQLSVVLFFLKHFCGSDSSDDKLSPDILNRL